MDGAPPSTHEDLEKYQFLFANANFENTDNSAEMLKEKDAVLLTK